MIKANLMTGFCKMILALLCLLHSFHLDAQKVFFEQITTVEGLPSDYVNGVFEDSKGHLWVGTDKGACRYDGRQFQYFNNDNGLTSNFVSCFAEDPAGNIWIGTINAGLCKYDGKRIIPYPIYNNDKTNVFRIHFNPDSSFFVVAEKEGVYFFKNENSAPQFFPDMAFIKLLNPGFFLTGSSTQLYTITLQNRQPVFQPLSHPKADLAIFIYWFSVDRIIALKRNSVFEYSVNGKTFEVKKEFMLNKPIPLPPWPDIKNILIIDDELFVATVSGLIYVDKENRQSFFSAESGLGVNYIKSVYKDKQQNIYICTYGAGIKIWPIRHLYEYKTSGKVTSIFPSGTKTYITTTESVYELNIPGNTFHEFKNQDAGSFTSIYLDKKEYVYLGTLNNFYKLPAGDFKKNITVNLSPRYSFTANTGSSGFLEYNNKMHISTYGDGIYLFNDSNKVMDTLNSDKKPGSQNIVEFLVPLISSFAALTYNSGLTFYNSSGSPVPLSKKDGLLSNTVYSVFQEKEDEIWIGTQSGLNLHDGKKISKTFSVDKGLAGTKVLCIFRDSLQRFWVLSDRYLHLLENGRLRAIRSHPVLFKANNSINRSAFNTATNTLIIGLTDALLAVNMNRIIPDTLVNEPGLIRIKKDTISLLPKNNNEISFSSPVSKISFEFNARHYSVSRQADIYFKLNGFDDEWNLLTDGAEAVYSRLPPGNYELIAKTMNPDGYESAETSLIKLEVLPPLWKRSWFIAAAAAVLLGLFFYTGNVISRRRYKRKLRQLQEEYRLQLERERIARELHDNVGSQLTYLINKIDDDYPRLSEKKEAEKLSSFARGAMQELRETIWALDRKEVQWDDLENKTRQLTRLYQNENHTVGIDWQIQNKQQPPLNPLEALNIYRIIQESLNNAEKYSNAGIIKVYVHRHNDKISVEIKDNGKGFNVSQAENGYGLNNMRKRAEEMNAGFSIESEPGSGTTIKLTLS